ncbi:MAG TPA: TolC family protein [Myxococcaceae bacterium]
MALTVAAPTCGPLDLQTAQALALARSDEVGIKRSELAAAEADRAIATSIRWLPEFSMNMGAGVVPGARLVTTPHAVADLDPNGKPTGTFHTDYRTDPKNVSDAEGTNRGLGDLGPFWRVEINALQPIYTFGRIEAANDAADSGARARKFLVDDTANAIRTRVVTLVMGIRLTTRLLAIASDVQGALKEADARVQKSLKANDGEITPEDRYRIEIFRSQLNQRVADGERALRVARVGLAATLAMEPDQLQLRDDPLPDTSQIKPPDLVAALSDSDRQRPDLKALDNGILAKEADVKATRAELFPQIGIIGQFAYSRAPGRDTITNPYIGDYFNALTIGAVLGIKQNLSFWTVITRTNKKEAELDTLRKQRAGAVRAIHVEVETAVADLNAAITKREASAKAVAAGRSWFRSATLNFGVGVGDGRDLIDAYRGYAEAQYGDAQATFDLLAAQARLEQVTGRVPPAPELNCQMP